ncbi:polyprenyl synthetase family protein [Candidatus Sumerlaeota bacterium]|nr:polyprenyl synthetase family protein [Candidatus Sumerlaeota bacterium]
MERSFFDFRSEIAQVERHIREAATADVRLLNEAIDYIAPEKGKKLRPRLVLSAAYSLLDADEPTPEFADTAIRVAAAVELIHTASLLHDDVVDRAEMRRGRPSVNARFGDNVAILIADLLFSHAFDLVLSSLEPEAMRLVCRATREMCESEIRQIERGPDVLSEADYYQGIRAKTALLFSVSAELGAILARASVERREALARFGIEVGMAYQICDDVLDYTAGDGRWGKGVGNDLAQGKQTLPLIRALDVASDEDRQYLLSQLRNGREMHKVFPVIQKYRGIEYATDKAREFAARAGEVLSLVHPGSGEDLFRDFCRFAVDRSY